jgi:hypothetical protein
MSRAVLSAAWAVLGFSSAVSASTTERPPCTHNYCDIQNSLFGWIEANGGYINPKIELSTGPDENWNIRGVFATSKIYEDEKIFSLTPALQICSTDMCELVGKVRDELQKGEESFYWPYISAMEDHFVDVPSIWNEHERSLLVGLQPTDWQRHLVWFEHSCQGDVNDAHHLRAMLLVVARSNGNDDQSCMSPLYDSLNHGNGDQVNTANRYEGTNFEKVASVPIQAGAQVFNSFGDSDVGRLFRDYGFIAQYPRLWAFEGADGQQYTFECFDDNGMMTIDTNPFNAPHQHSPEALAEQLARHIEAIQEVEVPEYGEDDPNLDPWRHRMALEYRAEYMHAMTTALQATNSLITSNSEM